MTLEPMARFEGKVSKMPFRRQRARVERMGVVDGFMSPPGLDLWFIGRPPFFGLIITLVFAVRNYGVRVAGFGGETCKPSG